MISIYDHNDYRSYLEAWIQIQKNQGHGSRGKLAEAAGVSSTLISLILKSEKHLSLEQAAEIGDFMGLNENESDYFLLLVEFGRAGSFKLQQKFQKKIKAAQSQAKQISKRVKKDIEISDEIKAIYYSSWIYTGIRNLVAIEGFNDPQIIARRLNLPLIVVNKAKDFLVENGLCKMQQGKLVHGPASLHVAAQSPFVVKHHQNWRLRGFHNMEQFDEANLFFTCPMSVSMEVAEEVRRLLPKVIEQVMKMVGPSPSEKAYCFNIDWFEY